MTIHVPNNYAPERAYIVQVLIHDFLGIDYQILSEERKDLLIESQGHFDGKVLRICDVLFQTPDNQWLTSASLPEQPLPVWGAGASMQGIFLVDSSIPVIYGCDPAGQGLGKGYLRENQNELYLGLDIFGSAFFMLTRYEELVKPDRDEYDRFPGKASLAYQEHFLDRPIVNEYLEILWWCMKRLWPVLERKKRNCTTVLSHDVDVPYRGILRLIRDCGRDVWQRHAISMAMQRIESWKIIWRGDYRQDLYFNFDVIMDMSEKYGLKSAFYFKTACSNRRFDDKYNIDHPYMKQLIMDMHRRGHEIGLHPSFETYKDPVQTKVEFDKLRQVCEDSGIRQDSWGGRQHYLRWQVPTTWRSWDEAGLAYDSTLTYPDHAGFRCGICYEYQVFDLETHTTMGLTERPLIVMEESILGEKYMNLEGQIALDYMLRMKKICRKFNGDFTLLWHNSSLNTDDRWNMYEYLIRN